MSTTELPLISSAPAPCYYRALTQTVLLGLVCFCVPGMWNSITSMAGGISDKGVSSAATASLYGCFAVASVLAPIPTNIIGARATLGIGSGGYVLYVFALLLYSRTEAGSGTDENGSGGLVIAAGAVNGVGAGLLWTAQGALIMSYPSKEAKGLYVGIFWLIFNLGAVFGGLLSFGLNYSSDAGDASPGTFVAFGAVMIAGGLLTLTMAPAERVVRPDGSLVQLERFPAVSAELRGLLAVLRDWRMHALAPLFLYSNWFYAYQFVAYNSALFNARTEGLNNAFYWGAQMVGAVLVGRFLDASRLPLRQRALVSFWAISVLIGASW
eukprot:3455678-Prymnesium_polylepis.1